MSVPRRARSSVTGLPQTAFDRDHVVEPERQTPGVAETSPGEQAGSADGGQPVFDRVAKLERQLAAERKARVKRERQLEAEQQQRQQAEATLARQREQARARQQRRRDRNPEQMRKQHAEYMRGWRARRRGQGSSAPVHEQPVVAQVSELARLKEEARHAQAKLAHQRELKNARQRRWRQAHPEETRQRKREERERARRRQNPS